MPFNAPDAHHMPNWQSQNQKMDKMVSQNRELRENFVGGQTSIPTSYTERHAPRESYKPKGTQLPRENPDQSHGVLDML